MCLATPSKIVKIEGDWATVEVANPPSHKATAGKHIHRANLGLVKNIKIGDYVIVHGDLVLNKVEKQDALKILKIISASGGKNICGIKD